MSVKTQTPVIDLRAASPADVPAIVVIERLSFVHAGERFRRRRISYLTTNPRAIVFVAQENEEVLGWTAGLVWTRGKEPWGRIYALAVRPKARGRKLGRKLLQKMIDTLRQRGAGKIFLEVGDENPVAIRLYERNGFVVCRTLPNYYGQGRAAHRMVLSKPSPAASP